MCNFLLYEPPSLQELLSLYPIQQCSILLIKSGHHELGTAHKTSNTSNLRKQPFPENINKGTSYGCMTWSAYKFEKNDDNHQSNNFQLTNKSAKSKNLLKFPKLVLIVRFSWITLN